MRTSYKMIIGAGFISLLTSPALAADLPNSGRLLRESTPPPVLVPSKKPVIEAPAGRAPEPLSASIKVLVTGFTYSGNTAFTSEELNRIMAPAMGKEVTLAELEKSVEKITQAYRSKGYFLATAFIPPQAIKPGQPVKIEILEGKIEEINLKTSPSETRVPRTLLERYRDRITLDSPADKVRLTEITMLLNELPALKSRIVLEPGKRPGGTKASLEVAEGKPYVVSFFTDNHGNNSTGYYRVGADLGLYSPFRLGDRLSLRALTSTSGNTQNVGASWSVPVSSHGTTVTLDYSWVRYELGGRFKGLDAKGDANSFSLMVTQPLIRRSNISLNTFITGEGKFLDDSIEGLKQRHIIDGQAGLNLYAVDSLLGGGYSSFSITGTGGSLTFDDDAAKAMDQDVTGAHSGGVYFKISGVLSRTQSIYGDLSLFAGLNGQWSNKNLDSAEKFSLGGPFAVRAYPVGEASADLGMITTAELRYQLPKLGALPGSVQLAGLFDYGYAVINADPVAGSTGSSHNERKLSGAGFGVNWQWHELVSLRSSVSWRLGELPTSDSTSGDWPTFYFQANVRY